MISATVEDDPHLRRPAEADVVGDDRFEEGAAAAGLIEHDRAGRLDLAHRQLPPVAAGPIGIVERGRDDRHPPLEERVDVGRAEPIADRLQGGRVVTGPEPVGQLGEADPGGGGLLLGPLVPVQPDLGRIREVGAQLDEARPELGVPDVEVEDADPAIGLDERVARRAGLPGGQVVAGEHRLELLGHPDRHHPGSLAASR